jgi:putative transcriptional regulator
VLRIDTVSKGADHEAFTGADARVARERLGMTQFQVAVELGVTPQHVSNFENGRYALGRRLRVQLAELLGLPIDPDDVPQPTVLDEIRAEQAATAELLRQTNDRLEELSRLMTQLLESSNQASAASQRLRRAQRPSH